MLTKNFIANIASFNIKPAAILILATLFLSACNSSSTPTEPALSFSNFPSSIIADNTAKNSHAIFEVGIKNSGDLVPGRDYIVNLSSNDAQGITLSPGSCHLEKTRYRFFGFHSILTCRIDIEANANARIGNTTITGSAQGMTSFSELLKVDKPTPPPPPPPPPPPVTTEKFLVITDPHICGTSNSKTCAKITASQFQYGFDSSNSLLDRSMTELSNLVSSQNPKFALMLGDLPTHDLGKGAAGAQKRNLLEQQFLSTLRTHASSLPIFYVPGNNDSLYQDYGSFSHPIISPTLTPWDTDLSGGWPAATGIPICTTTSTSACVITKDPTFGFYTAYPEGPSKPLELIALNTNIFSVNYKGSGGDSDVQNELTWLNQRLADAAAKSKRVLIIMHIPPGIDPFLAKASPFWKSDALSGFLIAISNQTNIVGIISGHTHMDDLRRIKNSGGNLVAIDFGNAALSPIHKNNPAMEVYNYRSDNAAITDITTYYNNLATGTATWQSFQYSQLFGCVAGTTLYDCLAPKSAADIVGALLAQSGSDGPAYLAKSKAKTIDAAYQQRIIDDMDIK